MLQLKHIKKSYVGDGYSLNALDDVSVAFRKNEFVAILGPSGSGKTTLLNLIGGLDQYTDGDLIINGKSTKKFSDKDWDAYRNHSVGFVFQSYNLIPHQSVLANVELALTLSGVSRKERRKRAHEALEKVGLGDQANKKPNQMSGGQMQRVAIARALVNNPDILLADEPTGALDSATSVQIMELLKEVSRDRLVVMVTHNPELADAYANRIVRVRDGKVVDDTNPFDGEEPADDTSKQKHTNMSFMTALSLSLNNLMTKKARTFLTSFAGSIGIIGIALILALSSGVKLYIRQVQEDTLSSYPIQINAEEVDMGSLITNLMGAREASTQHERDAVYASSVMYDLVNTMNNTEISTNNLKKLKQHFESNTSGIDEHARAIHYIYNVPLHIYAELGGGQYQKSDIMDVFETLRKNAGGSSSSSALTTGLSTYSTWSELIPDLDGTGLSGVITDQYELLAGSWPEDKSDLLLVVDQNNEITDITLHAMGLKTTQQIISDLAASSGGEEVAPETLSFSYDDVLARRFRIVTAPDFLTDSNNDGVFESILDNETAVNLAISGGLELKIAGIARATKESGISTSSGASLYYTPALTQYLIDHTNASPAVQAQKKAENENFDVLTGLPFVLNETEELSPEQQAKELRDYFASLNAETKSEKYLAMLSVPDAAAMQQMIDATLAQYPDRAALEELIFTQYADASGFDEETIRSFIAQYSDDDLKQMIADQIKAMMEEQQKAQAEAAIKAIGDAPSETELAMFKQQISARLTDRNAKTMYIVSEYTKSTALSAETILAYLAAQSDETIDEMADKLITESAKALYAQYGSSDEAARNTKIAAAFDAYAAAMQDDQLAAYYDVCMPAKVSSSTLKDNLKAFGVADPDSPNAIYLYASTFADKDAIGDIISAYNDTVEEEDEIQYTDYVGLIMSSVTTIIDAISYVLIAFVSISLVVSSIMIGIITYISVLERTKEIGILRAIGASKRDISRVFNAETLIVGFTAGAIGIVFTILACFPLNAIIRHLSGIEILTAYLPWQGAVGLMFVSIFFTVVAGLLPSGIAAKKDPVVALRTE